jgi:hemerythrin-like metal-binding protein
MIKWDDSYSVHYDGIDEQHKILISIIQEVETAINAESYSFKGLIEVLNRLEEYIKVHFSYEEALMTKFDYPEKEQHFTEHNELRFKILSTNLDYIEKSKDFYTETYTYLFNWLINHIMKIDKKLALFLTEKNA